MNENSPLDNMAWSSLTNNHQHLGTIGKKAALYNPQVSMIATVKEETHEAFAELAELATPGVPVALVGNNSPDNHPDWMVIRNAEVHQMTRDTPLESTEMDFVTLTATDVPQMLELVELTKPGPFSPRTIEMGRYIGLKADGQLVAMGGERMKPVGYVELSAICTHPDFRGKGIAKAITGELTNSILERGLLPFLHVWVENKPAMKLYEKLGYEHRRNVPGAAMIKKKPPTN
jgi:predicted GNAT family acetyltransferase